MKNKSVRRKTTKESPRSFKTHTTKRRNNLAQREDSIHRVSRKSSKTNNVTSNTECDFLQGQKSDKKGIHTNSSNKSPSTCEQDLDDKHVPPAKDSSNNHPTYKVQSIRAWLNSNENQISQERLNLRQKTQSRKKSRHRSKSFNYESSPSILQTVCSFNHMQSTPYQLPSSSGTNTSTPVILPSTDTAKENLFGFEKLLCPKPPTMRNICDESPINTNCSGASKRRPLPRSTQKKKPWDNILEDHSKVKRKHKGLHKEANSEVVLFDIAKSSVVDPIEIKDQTSDADYDTSIEHEYRKTKKLTKKHQDCKKTYKKGTELHTKRKNVQPLVIPEIPWDDIMNHELVIE
ncbi:unnamed protein product [Clavelina lepadiformis]|uniref:Uncharacterized protein n=1 Tax=Clavelina lepadiformis TaxID=159417 RepID=A0ABP0GXS8_CLALP